MFGISKLRGQLMRIERKLDLLLEAYGIESEQLPGISDDSAKQIRALLDRGEKINAIREYRALSGAGLKEAKEYIESL